MLKHALAALLLAVSTGVHAIELIDGKCYDTREVPSAAPVTQSKVKRPKMVAPAASAPKRAKPKPKPTVKRWELYEVPCPAVPTIPPTTFETVPVLPPPVTFAAPETPIAPATPVAFADLPPPPLECDCFMTIGSYVWSGGEGGGGGYFVPPRVTPSVVVTPIPEPSTWLLLLSGAAVVLRRFSKG